ncbi:MAG: peptide ABC transporter substrate-binding protein, partial [Halioglobus sp.]|nr:peptide ABC transporter substrate-binding protein [Halioglobus sp.]
TREARYAVFHEAETLLMEQMPIIPVFTYTSKHLIHPSVNGMPPNLMDWANFKYVWLDRDWRASEAGD